MLNLHRLWTRSLRLRAVLLTGLFTLLGTGLVASFLISQVTDGFFQERFEQVETEATSGLGYVRSSLDTLPSTETTAVNDYVTSTFSDISGATSLPRETMLVPLEDAENLAVQPRATGGVEPDEVITDEMRDAVLGGQEQYWQSISYVNENGDTVPGVIFGLRITSLPQGSTYGTFFIYDFSSVQENIDFVFRILMIGVGILLVLNIAIALWLARTVVRPVSQAAEVSERIADGQLDQRLAVVGEDEIARLGQSFNRMASNLQDQIVQLANLSKMQQRFVSDVSHELRTPLTTIGMAASMLHESREDFDPMTQRTSELLHHQVERFEGLLADLLEMSRFDAGAAELSLNEVDLLGLTKEVLLTAKPLADQSETPVYLVVQGEDFRAEVDHRRIDRILRNLINNAIEHSEGRPVDIVIAASPTAVGVAVRDYGVGMTSEEVSRVFDRFWRADPARARTTGGSGLGLAIATEDTRLHSGSLDAWGQKGQGSCFRLVLPRSQEAPYRAAPLALPPSYATHERQSVEDRDLISAAAAHERVHEQALNDQPLSAAARAEDAPEPGAAEDDDEGGVR
ncbi:MtrAB system histidine kinase MtrB [Nesterenkonia sp. NBAIMH1]|uniref:MtrAB system histidine kinase MtrB n=1 Tax=Nesterenkonia sp. NBAIMH1 TaxID=2600320 RepID=UPI0011B82A32|nr:MtrAB system histidine kinase MtrB [Nesterenkonia sp. NBAIMH1]